jgi:hypothetical protein
VPLVFPCLSARALKSDRSSRDRLSGLDLEAAGFCSIAEREKRLHAY